MSFPKGIHCHLKSYVYRLIDPRNGETFYVGKGKNNRVFAHIRYAKIPGRIKSGNPDYKLSRINDIHNAGFDVSHVLHRHGLDDKSAKEVEAALIDAYPSLTNVMTGCGSNDFGAMHTKEIIKKYQSEVADFKHNALIINVNLSSTQYSTYEAVRYAWKINVSRAIKAEIVLAVSHGLIKDVFFAKKWHEATSENFPGRVPVPGRFGFEGCIADIEIKSLYIDKRLPDNFSKKGAANPIRYTYR
jgi:uncharacterized protein